VASRHCRQPGLGTKDQLLLDGARWIVLNPGDRPGAYDDERPPFDEVRALYIDPGVPVDLADAPVFRSVEYTALFALDNDLPREVAIVHRDHQECHVARGKRSARQLSKAGKLTCSVHYTCPWQHMSSLPEIIPCNFRRGRLFRKAATALGAVVLAFGH